MPFDLPDKDDKFIDFDTYYALVERVNKLERLFFDTEQFNVVNDGENTTVSLAQAFATGDSGNITMPFDVTPGTTSNKHVNVTQGYIRYAGLWNNRPASEIDCSADDHTGESYIYYTYHRTTRAVSNILWSKSYPSETETLRVRDIAYLTQSAGVVTAIVQKRHGQQDLEEFAELYSSATRESVGLITLPRTSSTADSNTWKVTDTNQDGFKIRLSTPIMISGTDKKYYGFYRDLTFDRTGRCVEVSGETRYDAAEGVVC